MEKFYGIPTVKFDSSKITEIVKADLRKNVELLEGIDPIYFDEIYEAALKSVTAGRDLFLLVSSLMQMNIDGMTKERAGIIAASLNNKASTIIKRDECEKLGITEAIWKYSGAPCKVDPKKPSQKDIRQDRAHKAANGKRYNISKGMYLNKKLTWPGCNDGCRCIGNPVIKAIDDGRSPSKRKDHQSTPQEEGSPVNSSIIPRTLKTIIRFFWKR